MSAIRFFLRVILRILFGFRVYEKNCLKTEGPCVILSNHVSWIDWLFLYVVLENDWKFITSQNTANISFFHKKISTCSRCIPIDLTSPLSAKHVADLLNKKARLVIFPEGTLSAEGELSKMLSGMTLLIQRPNVSFIAAYLRGARYLKWNRHGGLSRLFPQVSLHLKPLHIQALLGKDKIKESRHREVDILREAMLEHQLEVQLKYGPQTIPARFRAIYPLIKRKMVITDHNSTVLTGRKIVLGAHLLRGVLKNIIVPSKENRIGVLMPSVAATPVLMLALWQMGKTPAMLNFSAGMGTICACAQLAKLKQIITSRAFITQAKLDVQAFEQAGIQMIYLEDVKTKISLPAKLMALVFAKCVVPKKVTTDQTAVILFTSGSEGVPKGVELSHKNLIADVEQAVAFVCVHDREYIFNSLPVFHGFGLILGVTIPLTRGIRCFNYPSPLHFRIIPNIIHDCGCTILATTNTFLKGYAKYAHPCDFKRLKLCIVGGEKMQPAVVKLFEERFSILVTEGYGVTECAPIISVNNAMARKPGAVGRLLPGMRYKLAPIPGIEDGAGRLLVKGPNVMNGYLNEEANNAFQALEGWYDTGDVAHVDEAGFITLQGRVKRFAKISGEMISLTAVEDALREEFSKLSEELELAVGSISSEDRGESIIVATNDKRVQEANLAPIIQRSGLSNLCIPRVVVILEALPRLGSGKIDYMGLNKLLAQTVTEQ